MKIRYCKMSGPTSLDDLHEFAVNIFDDPKQSLSVLLLTEKLNWPSFQYKNEILEIIDSFEKDRIGSNLAIVIPNTTINEAVDYSLKDLRQKSLRVRYFSSEDAALSWLEV